MPAHCPAYLFGTMHVRAESVHQYASRVLPYIDSAEIFAGEMNLAELDPIELALSKRLPSGISIMDFYSDKQYRKIQKALRKSFAFDLNQFNSLHPFLVLAMISESQIEHDHEESLDQFLWIQAETLGKKMTGLESAADQMRIMRDIPLENSYRQLKQLAKSPQKLRRDLKKMLSYYEDQNIRQLFLMGKKQLQDLRRVLLYERNEVMAQRINTLMQQGPLFSAFGAGHLAGKKGVLRKLKLMGLRIEPIFI